MSDTLKTCPFCKSKADFPTDVFGTQYEYECECGLAMVSVQICDLMTHEERQCDNSYNHSTHQYNKVFIDRARREAITQWNTRTTDSVIQKLKEVDSCLQDYAGGINNPNRDKLAQAYIALQEAIQTLQGES